jgi:predicted ATPase
MPGDSSRPFKIVLTGAPGSGKSTIARTLAAQDPARFALVPEAATQYYTALGRKWNELALDQQRDAQRGIYHLQIEQEQRIANASPGRTLLLDRGTIDGAAYWPDGPAAYWADLGTTEAFELARYDLIVILETSAAIGLYDGDASNQVRFEDAPAAMENARLLERLWSGHARVHAVRAETDLTKKIDAVAALVYAIVRHPECAG